MKVTIDTREKERIQSATAYFKSQGLEVEVTELEVGDYIFTDSNNSVVFEFKLISDFISSIQSNRVFNQAISQAENFDYHFVLIHGDEYTRSKCLAMTRHYQPITVFQYIAAISSINRYSTVIECYSTYLEESYFRMLTQARKCLQNKPIVKKFPRKDKNPCFNWLAYCNYGINSTRATQIVNTLNLQTKKDLDKLTIDQLTKVEGIGSKTAKKIIENIGYL